jgi:hypothetical protein
MIRRSNGKSEATKNFEKYNSHILKKLQEIIAIRKDKRTEEELNLAREEITSLIQDYNKRLVQEGGEQAHGISLNFYLNLCNK